MHERSDPGPLQKIGETVASWLPQAPKPVKVAATVAFLYLGFCVFAQVSPVALFTALSGTINGFVEQSREEAAQQRADSRQERSDMIALLREQNAIQRREIEERNKADNAALSVAVQTRDALQRFVSSTEPRFTSHETRITGLEKRVNGIGSESAETRMRLDQIEKSRNVAPARFGK